MNAIELVIGEQSFKFSLPTGWDELSRNDLLHVCSISRMGLPKDSFLSETIMHMIPVSARNALFGQYAALSHTKQRQLPPEAKEVLDGQMMDITLEFSRLLDLMAWLADIPYLTRNPFPRLKMGRKKLYGPRDGMEDITYYQFALVDNLIREISLALGEDRPGDAEAAKARIVAVLWHQEKKGFEERHIQAKARYFSKLPSDIKDAIYLYALGSFRLVADTFPRIFSGDPEETDGPDYGHAGIILDLAGGKFGDIDKTQETSLYTILMYLDKEAARAEKKNGQNDTQAD